MTQEEALTLLRRHLKQENLVKHSIAVAACLKALADHYSEDRETWSLAGLLHDLDYEYTLDKPDEHTLVTEQLLAEEKLPDSVIQAIKGHNLKADHTSLLDRALYAVDPTSGFIIACALMHPQKKLEALDLAFLKKRYKEKSFAKGACRTQMASLEGDFDRFLSICLAGMQDASAELGL